MSQDVPICVRNTGLHEAIRETLRDVSAICRPEGISAPRKYIGRLAELFAEELQRKIGERHPADSSALGEGNRGGLALPIDLLPLQSKLLAQSHTSSQGKGNGSPFNGRKMLLKMLQFFVGEKPVFLWLR